MSDILYKKFLHKDANFKKLATREDPYHVHKTLGILSVCSFVYRYGYVYVPLLKCCSCLFCNFIFMHDKMHSKPCTNKQHDKIYSRPCTNKKPSLLL